MAVDNSTREINPPIQEIYGYLREVFECSSAFPDVDQTEFPLVYTSGGFVSLLYRMGEDQFREMTTALTEKVKTENETCKPCNAKGFVGSFTASSEFSKGVNYSNVDISMDEGGKEAVQESCSLGESKAEGSGSSEEKPKVTERASLESHSAKISEAEVTEDSANNEVHSEEETEVAIEDSYTASERDVTGKMSEESTGETGWKLIEEFSEEENIPGSEAEISHGDLRCSFVETRGMAENNSTIEINPPTQEYCYLREVFACSSALPDIAETEFPLIYKSRDSIAIVHIMSRDKLREMATALMEKAEAEDETCKPCDAKEFVDNITPSSSNFFKGVNESNADASMDGESGEKGVQESCSPEESEDAVSPGEILKDKNISQQQIEDEENDVPEEFSTQNASSSSPDDIPKYEESGFLEEVSTQNEGSSSPEDVPEYEGKVSLDAVESCSTPEEKPKVTERSAFENHSPGDESFTASERDVAVTMSEEGNDNSSVDESLMANDISDSQAETSKQSLISERTRTKNETEEVNASPMRLKRKYFAPDSSNVDTPEHDITSTSQVSFNINNNGKTSEGKEETDMSMTNIADDATAAEKDIHVMISEGNAGESDDIRSVDRSPENDQIPDSKAKSPKSSSISLRAENGAEETDAVPTHLGREVKPDSSPDSSPEHDITSTSQVSFNINNNGKTSEGKEETDMSMPDIADDATASEREVYVILSEGNSGESDDNRSVDRSPENCQIPDAKSSKSSSISRRAENGADKTDAVPTHLGREVKPDSSKVVTPEHDITSESIKDSSNIENNVTLEKHSGEGKEKTEMSDDASSTATERDVEETMSEEDAGESDYNGSPVESLKTVGIRDPNVKSSESSSVSKKTRMKNGADETDAAPTRLGRKNLAPNLPMEVPEHDSLSKSRSFKIRSLNVSSSGSAAGPASRITRSKSREPSPIKVNPSLRDIKSSKTSSAESLRIRRSMTHDTKLKSDIKVSVRSSPRKPPRTVSTATESSSKEPSTSTPRNGVAPRTTENVSHSYPYSVSTRRSKRT